MINFNGLNVGDKLYRHVKDVAVIVRIIKIVKDKYYLQNTTDKEDVEVHTSNSLHYRYTKLRPLGSVVVALVKTNGVQDIFVSLYRNEDVRSGNYAPYAICRQNIFDMFAQQTGNMNLLGMSINKDNTPANVNYEEILACDKVNMVKTVSFYMDDVLDKILELINTKPYDKFLKENSIHNRLENMEGYSLSLRELLLDNNFMFDFNSAFNITKVEFEIMYDKETNELDNEQLISFEDVLKIEMFRTYVVPNGHDVNLQLIQRKHILVSDINNNIFIIAYDEGKHINRYYKQNTRLARESSVINKKLKGK